MAEQDPTRQNDGTPPAEPADEPVTYTLGGQVHRGTLRATPAANVIPKTDVTPGDAPVVAVCPYCRANLSKHALGRYVQGPTGTVVEVLWPAQCTECNHPLLFVKTSGIIPARNLPGGAP